MSSSRRDVPFMTAIRLKPHFPMKQKHTYSICGMTYHFEGSKCHFMIMSVRILEAVVYKTTTRRANYVLCLSILLLCASVPTGTMVANSSRIETNARRGSWYNTYTVSVKCINRVQCCKQGANKGGVPSPLLGQLAQYSHLLSYHNEFQNRELVY